MEEVEVIKTEWKHWHYKNTALLILSLVIFFFFAEHPIIKSTISQIGNLGYFGAFLAGILFVSIFTIAPAAVVIFFLADTLNPVWVAIVAGMGGVLGDFLIYKLFKDRVFAELEPLFLKSGGSIFKRLFKTPHFGWLLPIIGAVIIASPIPDEIGIGFLGGSKLKNWQFLLLTMIVNPIGIFLIILTAKSLN